MAIYKCSVCGELYDESKEEIPFSELPNDWKCPLCGSPKSAFHPLNECYVRSRKEGDVTITSTDCTVNEPVKAGYERSVMDDIRFMAYTGTSPDVSMETDISVPGFDEILICGAQLSVFPKDSYFYPDISVIIGKGCERPMRLSMPVFISHMSFGSLSYNAKLALAKASASVGTAVGSGEGGVLKEEAEYASVYIFEYVPNKYSVSQETFDMCDAVEIKIGQSTKPGMGGFLPGEKVTEKIAEMRGKVPGADIQSPSRFEEINSPEDMKELVDFLRFRTGGKPIGIKIAAGNIEGDLEFISKTGCDFVTIDGRGGSTGSSPGFVRDNTSVPTVYAVSRARRYMNCHRMTQDLIVTGGLRTSGDVVKALAMGADAVAMASAPLIALGCQRFRMCGSGKCPVGIAAQDPEYVNRLDIDSGAERVSNFLSALASEIRTFVRLTGHDTVSDLSPDDLCTVSSEISENCCIKHA